MNQLLIATRKFLRDEEGVTIIEYALMAALIALGVVGTVIAMRTQLNALFNKIATCLTNATATNCNP